MNLSKLPPWRWVLALNSTIKKLKQEPELPDYATTIATYTAVYEDTIRTLWDRFKVNPSKANAKALIEALIDESTNAWELLALELFGVEAEQLLDVHKRMIRESLEEHQKYLEDSFYPDLITAIEENKPLENMDYRLIFLYSGALWSFGYLISVTFDGLEYRDLGDLFIFAGPNDESTCTGERGCKQYANKIFTVAQILQDNIIPGRLRCLKNCRHMLLPIASPLGKRKKKELTLKGGPGSGHWGHAGRPGKAGGSISGGGLRGIGALSWSNPEQRREIAAEFKARRAEIRKSIDHVVAALGYDPRLVKYLGEGYEFEVGGDHYKAAASFDPKNGVIRVYEGSVTQLGLLGSSVNMGIMAHEIQHAKWHNFMQKAESQKTEIDKRYAEEVKNKVPYDKSFMTVAGDLKREEDKQKYSAYLQMQKMQTDNRFAYPKDDGVTAYSQSYWKEHATTKKTANFFRAIDETLAEMAKLEVTGNWDPSDVSGGDYPITKLWADTYNMVQSHNE